MPNGKPPRTQRSTPASIPAPELDAAKLESEQANQAASKQVGLNQPPTSAPELIQQMKDLAASGQAFAQRGQELAKAIAQSTSESQRSENQRLFDENQRQFFLNQRQINLVRADFYNGQFNAGVS